MRSSLPRCHHRLQRFSQRRQQRDRLVVVSHRVVLALRLLQRHDLCHLPLSRHLACLERAGEERRDLVLLCIDRGEEGVLPESELADAQAKSRVGWREVLAEDRTSTGAREAAVGEEAAEVRDGAGTGGGE